MNFYDITENAPKVVDFISKYLESIDKIPVTPQVKPKYLLKLLEQEAPKKPDSWDDILKDLEEKIMPGMVHWAHPHFHQQVNAMSFPSILGDMIAAGLAGIGFSWISMPAYTELENICLDWMANALDLPDHLIFSKSENSGGGVLQTSSGECILVSFMAARHQAINYLKELDGIEESSRDFDNTYLPKLIAYCSRNGNSYLAKAAKLSLVTIRYLETDEFNSLTGAILEKAIHEDIAKGIHPFIVVATLGTSITYSFDKVREIGEVLKTIPACWLHCDAAVAGNSFICPQFRGWMDGIEYVDSINISFNKMLPIAFDCAALYVKQSQRLVKAMTINPLYLHEEEETINYRHWGIPLSRRFRAMKIWVTLRLYGIENIQQHVMRQVKMARHFETLVRKDERFVVFNDNTLNVVSFRMKEAGFENRTLAERVNRAGEIRLNLCKVKKDYVLQYAVSYEHSTYEHNDYAWRAIIKQTRDSPIDSFKALRLNVAREVATLLVEGVEADVIKHFSEQQVVMEKHF